MSTPTHLDTPARRAATGGEVETVVPDAFADAVLFSPLSVEPFIGVYDRSVFFEAKAVNGTIRLASNDFQALGLVDVAAHSALARSLQEVPWPVVMFVTTANTVIANDIVSTATQQKVEIRQMVAEETAGWISLPTSKTLNPPALWQPTLHQLSTRACNLLGNPGPGAALPVDDPDFPVIKP